MPPRIALVTCAEARQLDADLAPLESALVELGASVEIVDWDNAAVDWTRFTAAIVRSAWDYHSRLGEYFAFVDRAGSQTRLLNSPELLKWNCDKRYLLEVHAAGVPIIPTAFVSSVDELGSATLHGDVVLKPAVSAGANNTERFRDDADAAERFARRLLDEGHVVMVQPYQRSVDEHGEIGLVYMNGELSHAFCKGAILGEAELVKNDLFWEEEINPAVASSEHLRVGGEVIDFLRRRFDGAPLYVRVDTVLNDSGEVVIMEIEANEPSLFFATDSTSAGRFARAVLGVVSPS